MNVLVSNRQRHVALDLPVIAAFARKAGQACVRLERPGSFAPADLQMVEVSLVSDRRIAGLHRRFLQVRGATDVITFEHGEIVISAQAAARGALEHGGPLERELCRYIVHGLLHLLGHEDDAPAPKAQMWREQERMLRRLWPPPAAAPTKVRKRARRR